MGYKQSPSLIMAALLLWTPLAYGQLMPDIPLDIVSGRICCTSTGNCALGSVGIPGGRVSLNYATLLGTLVSAAQGAISPTGDFNFNLRRNITPGLFGSVNGILPYKVVVNLPLNSTVCPILNTVNGTLIGVPIPQFAVSNAVFGFINYYVVRVFNIVSFGN
ncbi:hypothetical protein AAHA92_30623 [Salvia divinorum]|uniref:Secreted protein n=1 Tax=Salvia divinorum TaxID=28513 RepID=A0ABD1FRG9_SALDI